MATDPTQYWFTQKAEVVKTTSFDASSPLWSNVEPHPYFAELVLEHRVQTGGACVSTGLSLLSQEPPARIRQQVNTQDPVSWSAYLQRFGMKLAYCSTDLRALTHYVPELVAHNDLFVVCTYSPTQAETIGQKPDASGWVCGSHFTLLHRDQMYDTRFYEPKPLNDYVDLDRYVKRIFRVLPASHTRGL